MCRNNYHYSATLIRRKEVSVSWNFNMLFATLEIFASLSEISFSRFLIPSTLNFSGTVSHNRSRLRSRTIAQNVLYENSF